MSSPHVSATSWSKSSFSQGANANCIEVNLAPDAVYVRHSQHPADAVIRYTHTEWDAFTRSVKADELERGSR